MIVGKGFMVDVFVKVNPTDPLRLVTDDFITFRIKKGESQGKNTESQGKNVTLEL